MQLEPIPNVDDVERILKLCVAETLSQPIDTDGVTLEKWENIACKTVIQPKSKAVGV